jgi:hypothetical protein
MILSFFLFWRHVYLRESRGTRMPKFKFVEVWLFSPHASASCVLIVHPLHCFSLWNGCRERLEDRRAGLERNEFVFVPAHRPLAFKNAKPNYLLHTHTNNAPHVTYAKRWWQRQTSPDVLGRMMGTIERRIQTVNPHHCIFNACLEQDDRKTSSHVLLILIE